MLHHFHIRLLVNMLVEVIVIYIPDNKMETARAVKQTHWCITSTGINIIIFTGLHAAKKYYQRMGLLFVKDCSRF